MLEALHEGKSLHRVLFLKGKQTEELSEILSTCRSMSIPAQAVPKERLDRVTRKNHQGVVAFLSPIEFQPLDEVVMAAFERGEDPLMLALDGVTDVRNLGAIARTAECFGVTALVVPSTGSAPVNEDAIKSSAGALLRIPMCRVPSMSRAMKEIVPARVDAHRLEREGRNACGSLEFGRACMPGGGGRTRWDFRRSPCLVHVHGTHSHARQNGKPQRRRGNRGGVIRVTQRVTHAFCACLGRCVNVFMYIYNSFIL